MSVKGCFIPNTTVFFSLASMSLIPRFHINTKIPLENLWNGFPATSLWFLSCLTSMFRASFSEAFFKGAHELSLLVGLAADFNCKNWVTRTIFLMMATFELLSSSIISNSRRIKALSWLRMHALVMTWDIWTCHGLACANQPRFWMRELVIA